MCGRIGCHLMAVTVLMCAGCGGVMMMSREMPAMSPTAAMAAGGEMASGGVSGEMPKLAAEIPLQRIVIYSGLVGLVVPDIRQTMESVRAKCLALGGYLQEQDNNSITVRIPAGKFNEMVSYVTTLGETTEQHVKSQDVTEEMRDLKIRLANAEQARVRLLAILEKAGKLEDTLKVEAELERVTQTIELLKGKIQAMESQVAFSVLKVCLNSPLPQEQLVAAIPFEWVRCLGEGVISGVAAPSAQTSSRDRRQIQFDVPKSYIRYFDRDCVTEAMSADGVLIKVQKQDNYKGGDVDFWSKLARRALVENRSVAFAREETISTKRGPIGRLMVGTRDLGGKRQGYLVAVIVNEDNVYTYETWGPKEQFEKDLVAIESSVRTLDP
jgi:hypothetical protein